MTDRDKVFQVQAEALIVSLTQLLEEKELMTVETLDDFLAAFAVVFPEYLHATSQKFSPESIAAGAVSCAGAALLLGIWCEKHGFQTSFLSEVAPSDHLRIQHVTVLVSTEKRTAPEVRKAFSAAQKGITAVDTIFITYWKKGNLQRWEPTSDEKIDQVFTNSTTFLAANLKTQEKMLYGV